MRAAAAYWLPRATGRVLAQGAGAGAIAGLGALVAAFVAFTVLGAVLGTDPALQDLVRSSEPHPEARVPYEWIPSLGGAPGGLVGLGVGLMQLVLAAFGGLVVGRVTGTERRDLPQATG
jgi:hypothetical protein